MDFFELILLGNCQQNQCYLIGGCFTVVPQLFHEMLFQGVSRRRVLNQLLFVHRLNAAKRKSSLSLSLFQSTPTPLPITAKDTVKTSLVYTCPDYHGYQILKLKYRITSVYIVVSSSEHSFKLPMGCQLLSQLGQGIFLCQRQICTCFVSRGECCWVDALSDPRDEARSIFRKLLDNTLSPLISQS